MFMPLEIPVLLQGVFIETGKMAGVAVLLMNSIGGVLQLIHVWSELRPVGEIEVTVIDTHGEQK